MMKHALFGIWNKTAAEVGPYLLQRRRGPEGLPNVAQRFDAGREADKIVVPEGRAKSGEARPSGTRFHDLLTQR